jgi:hypothetical protein
MYKWEQIMSKKPSLADLGLDEPTQSPAQPEKISIRSLQLESEQENLSTSGQMSSHASPAPANSSENVLGIVGFVLSIVGLMSAGCISPIAMIVCFFALGKKPVGLAVAGLILSVLGTIGIAIAVLLFAAGLIVG